VSQNFPLFRRFAVCLQASLVMAFLLAAGASHAQITGTGNIQGTVTDQSGAIVPSATVTLTDESTGVKRTVQTDSSGVYLFPNIDIGKYDVQAKAPGFETYVQTGIVLEVGSNIAINPALKVGASDTKVEVHAETLALQTEDTSFKQTIDQSTVEEMPLNGRQMTALITLSGGSTTAPGGDFTGSKYSYQTIAVSVAGGMGNTTEWKLDGGDENEYMGNGNLPFPFPDAVSQFSVESTALGAQSGSTHSGGLVNVVTRAGTNQYHGDAFEFIRNNYIDGTNFFATSHDTLHQNQFGGTFGGPVLPWKHKELFVFAGYQRLKADQASSNLEMYIPTPANLTGDWSVTDPPPSAGGQQLYDPLTGVAIPGNKYASPPTYNPQALNLMAYMPTNYINPSNGEVSFAIPSETFDNQFVTRVDYTINPRNNFFARYFIDGYQAPSFFFKGGTNGGILVTSQAPGNYERVQTAVVGEAFTWRSNLVNSFHAYGTKRVDLRQSAPGINGNTLGIVQYDEVPTNLELEVTGQIAAWNTYCGTCSNGFFNVDDEGVADDLTWVKGKHQLVIGGEFLKVHFNEVAGFQANGNYQFSGEFSGNGPLGGSVIGNGNLDFLWGAMNLFGQSKEQQLALRGPVPSMYIQDTYHASNRLTLAGGVRWEPEFMPRDQFNRGSTFSMAAFLADQVSSVYPTAPPGSFFYGDPGVPKAFTTNPIWNFNPNIGATWDPFGNGNTVIRGGLQLAYDEANFYTTNRNHQNPPFATNVNVNITGPICFSEPWLAGGTGYGCDQTGGSNTSPFPQPEVPTPSDAVFPALGEWIEITSPYKVADTLQWTLSVQHQFPRGWQAQVDYIGNHTANMPVGTEMDPAIYTPGTWGPNLTGCGPVVTSGPAFQAVASKYSAPGAPCSVTGDQQLRYAFTEANPAYGNQYAGGSSNGMILVSNIGYANYNAMVATLQHRLSSTFVILTNYTWSHCLNIADASGDWSSTPLEDPYEPHKDYARCGSDYRNVFNTSAVYTTAFPLNGVSKWLANGWEIAPLIHITSGGPINITDGTDISLTDTGNDRPNLVPGVQIKTGVKLQGGHAAASVATRGWLNAAAFCSNQSSCASLNVAPGTFGDLGRNAINGPMLFQDDGQISRLFPIRERVSIQTRLEAFNILNHPSFSNPTATVSSKTFGEISGTSIGARIFQGSLKVIF
jgi:Carboxypeptidase regulatory-like domain